MDATESQKTRGILNRSAPTAIIVPVLIYEDMGKAIDWLCRAFGFTERLRAGGRDGRVTHAQLSVGEGAIMLGAQGACESACPVSALIVQVDYFRVARHPSRINREVRWIGCGRQLGH